MPCAPPVRQVLDGRCRTRYQNGVVNRAPSPEDLASVDGLNPNDPGWRALMEGLADVPLERRLLAYCGIDGRALGVRLILDRREASLHPEDVATWSQLAREGRRFAACAVWPRAHLGKDFTALSLAQAGLLLEEGGALWMAARKNKGAKSLAQILTRIFGVKPEILDRVSGYSVYRVEKGPEFDPASAQEILDQRYEIHDERLPKQGLLSAPGVFSRKALDAGTAALIDAVQEDPELATRPPRTVIDLCCGIAPLAIYAALRWPETQVLAIESNLVAQALAQENVRRIGLEERVTVLNENGFPEPRSCEPKIRHMAGRARLALVNPPTHATPQALAALLGPLRDWMGPQGRGFFVVSRPGSVTRALEKSGAQVHGQERDGYWILIATWPDPPLESPLCESR